MDFLHPYFFRPLTLKKRRLVAACIRTFHERLYGSHADYRSILGREDLRDLFVQTMRSMEPVEQQEDDAEEGFAASDLSDEIKMASAIVRLLVADGWIEMAEDRVRLITAYRFTRPGKIFAQALAVADRPRERTRQRNMRSCKNALAAFVERRDVEDLLDAFEYADRVISDLSEDIELFYELARKILVDAHQQGNWDGFIEFVERRFRDEFSPRLVYDNAERHRLDIVALIERLRDLSIPEADVIDAELDNHAAWAAQAAPEGEALRWLLDRIDEMVTAACRTKQPELFRAMESYVRRHVVLLSQSLFMNASGSGAALSSVIREVGAMAPDAQTAWLARQGARLAPAAVALYDPATVQPRRVSDRQRAQTISIIPEITREERLRQFVHQWQDRAFSLSKEEVVDHLLAHMGGSGAVQLSDLPVNDAMQALSLLRAVQSARESEVLEVERLDGQPLENAIMSGTDYVIRRRHVGRG